ncbi:MAG: AmmeMemoRadiSam system radical SAM enzyme [Candidatus Zixiibacteriota bacterium]
MKLNRRKFIKCSLAAAGCALAPKFLTGSDPLNFIPQAYAQTRATDLSHVEALYYKKLDYKEVECELCPRKCKVGNKERGYCGVRENEEGTYYTLVHSRVCSAGVDPIEKKPFFHYLPGTRSFSIATAGCNMNCKFCQNWQISQVRPEQVDNYYLPPDAVARYAKANNCVSIAYTYSEPIIFYEYMLDCARAGHDYGLKSVIITAGYIEHDPLVELCKNLDAVKIDFKAFTDKYYREVCSCELKPIMDVLVELKKIGIWYEIVYLMVPTLNDDMKDIKKMCEWMKKELGTDVPIHFSRFHPTYLMKNLPPTPVSSLERAHQIALETGLNYVYIGNVAGHNAENTYCHKCKEIVVGRIGYTITQMNLNDGKCKFCGEPIPGVWG